MKKVFMLVSLLAASHVTLAESSINWFDAPQVKALPQWSHNKNITANQWQQQAVQYNINMIGQELDDVNNSGYIAESKSFYLDVNGQKLLKGVDIPVLSQSAVIRLSSLNEKNTLEGRQVQLTQDKKLLSTQVMASGSQLKELGMTVPENTVAMKVSHQAGTLQLKLNGNITADEHFVIQVLEPDSQYRLAVATSKQLYQAGEVFNVSADLLANHDQLPMQIQGYISKPDGEKFADLTFTADASGHMTAQLTQLPLQSLDEGLWEVHTIAQSQVAGQTLLRDVSSAFAISMPTAQFDGQLTLSQTEITLGVNSQVASRYEINGLLMGHDKTGQLKPIAMLMTADWLQKGQNALNFKLPLDLIKSSGLKAPFTVQQLNLKNQSLMAPVQQVEAGFEFTIQ